MLPPSVQFPAELFHSPMVSWITQETKDLPNAPRLQGGRRAPAAHRQLRAPGSGLGGAGREAHRARVLGWLRGLRIEILVGRMVKGWRKVVDFPMDFLGHGVC